MDELTGGVKVRERERKPIEFDFSYLVTGKSKTLNTTIAEVALTEGGKTVIHVGVADCNPLDVFTKARGRVIALSRAVAKLDRVERVRIFNAFWKTGARKPKVFPSKVVEEVYYN